MAFSVERLLSARVRRSGAPRKGARQGLRTHRRCARTSCPSGRRANLICCSHGFCDEREGFKMSGGRFATAAVAVAIVAGPAAAQAQNYPARPITIVVPAAPGGTADF